METELTLKILAEQGLSQEELRDIGRVTENVLGNALNSLYGYLQLYEATSEPRELEEIETAKTDFYRALNGFIGLLRRGDLKPSDKINEETLKRLYEYKDMDWTMEIAEEVKGYINRLLEI